MKKPVSKSYSNTNKTLSCLGLGCGLLLATPLGALADEWQFEATPYIFATSIDVDVGVGPINTEIDAGFDDILDNLEFTLMGEFEARNDRLILAFDAAYLKLGKNKSSSLSGPAGRNRVDGAASITSDELIFQPTIGYRMLDEKTKFDAFFAVRYTKLESEVEINIATTVPSFPGGSRTSKTDKDWVDPVIGGRLIWPFAEQWSFVGIADVGGFGAGSDLTYQGIALVKWQFSDVLSAKAGYRLLYQDFEEDAFRWEVTYRGFILGLGIIF